MASTDHASRTVPSSELGKAADMGKFMTFKLASEIYALPILTVREIIGLMDITRVPRTADYVRGVINLRGKVISVVDLRTKFGMAAIEPTDQTVIIVVQYEVDEVVSHMGLLVDEVLEVLTISPADIDPPPDFGVGNDGDFLLGVGKVQTEIVFILDIGKVLMTENLQHWKR